jgi:hypothetical protein
LIGIGLAPGVTRTNVTGNHALGNARFDLLDANPGCDANRWEGNQFATANQRCIR